jgi:hypothetical protein
MDMAVVDQGKEVVLFDDFVGNKGALACILAMGLHGELGRRGIRKFRAGIPPPTAILQVHVWRLMST